MADGRLFPLAPQQLRLWRCIEQYGAAPFAAHAQIDFSWTGNAATLFDAVARCRRRHAALNLEIVTSPDGAALQRIADACDPQCEELPGVIAGAALQAMWTRQTQERHAARLNPRRAEGGLLASLLHLGQERVRLYLCASALFVDRRSMALLATEIAADVNGKASNAPERIPFSELCSWYAELRTSTEAAAGRRFWRKLALATPPASGAHPEFDANNAGASPRYASITRTYAARQTDNLPEPDKFADICAGAFAVVLGRTFSTSEIELSRVLSGRQLEGLGDCIGALASTACFPFRLAAHRRFAELLAEHQAALQEACDWIELIDTECLPGNAADAPNDNRARFVFESFFEPRESATINATLKAISQTNLAGLKLEHVFAAGMHQLALHYDETRCPADFARRLLDGCIECIHDVLSAPARRLCLLRVVGHTEAQQQLGKFTGPADPLDNGAQWLTSRLHFAAAHYADRIAVEQPSPASGSVASRTLTFGELFALTAAIAQRLRQACPTPGAPVGVLLERSPEALAACLAVYLAGHSYVPLDWRYPRQRVALAAKQARVEVCLSSRQQSETLRLCGCPGILIEDIDPAKAADLPPGPSDNGTAYAIATSGSSGKPRLVAVDRAALGNQLRWFLSAFPLAGARYLQRTSLGFDASLWELWVPVLSGNTMVIAPAATDNDIPALLNFLRVQRIEVLQLIPTLLGAIGDWLAANPSNKPLAALKQLFVGGEPLTQHLLRLRGLPHSTAVHNLYGPTECCVQVTAWKWQREQRQSAPVGRPISNCRSYILDDALALVPSGANGEICLAGDCLAIGYLGAPAATAEVFVPDPFGDPGSRLFRSGDYGHLTSDGFIHFAGRHDTRCKVNGCRIEAAEVETWINAVPGVQAACVYSDGGRTLVALVVPQRGQPGTQEQPASEVLPETVNSALQAVLPPFVLPVRVQLADAALYRPNGKLDRRRMIARSRASLAPQSGRHERLLRPPVTDHQIAIAAIWSELLNLEEVNIDTDFFSLGGHSLIFVQVVNRIRFEFGVEISLRLIFDNPTIEMLAAQVTRQLDARANAAQLPAP